MIRSISPNQFGISCYSPLVAGRCHYLVSNNAIALPRRPLWHGQRGQELKHLWVIVDGISIRLSLV